MLPLFPFHLNPISSVMIYILYTIYILFVTLSASSSLPVTQSRAISIQHSSSTQRISSSFRSSSVPQSSFLHHASSVSLPRHTSSAAVESREALHASLSSSFAVSIHTLPIPQRLTSQILDRLAHIKPPMLYPSKSHPYANIISHDARTMNASPSFKIPFKAVMWTYITKWNVSEVDFAWIDPWRWHVTRTAEALQHPWPFVSRSDAVQEWLRVYHAVFSAPKPFMTREISAEGIRRVWRHVLILDPAFRLVWGRYRLLPMWEYLDRSLRKYELANVDKILEDVAYMLNDEFRVYGEWQHVEKGVLEALEEMTGWNGQREVWEHGPVGDVRRRKLKVTKDVVEKWRLKHPDRHGWWWWQWWGSSKNAIEAKTRNMDPRSLSANQDVELRSPTRSDFETHPWSEDDWEEIHIDDHTRQKTSEMSTILDDATAVTPIVPQSGWWWTTWCRFAWCNSFQS